VRVRHLPTGLSGQSTESRSQHENKQRALRRLREAMMLEMRQQVDAPRFLPPPVLVGLLAAGRISEQRRKSTDYLVGMSVLLDLLVALDCSIAETAEILGISTGALSRFLLADERVGRKVNELRGERGLKALR
jgi:hypothetical protein